MARFVIDRSTRVALAVVVVIANVAGAGVVLVLAAWVLPEGPLSDPATVRLINLLTFCGYLVLALPVGLLWGALRFRMPAGDADTEQHLVLHGPLRLVTVQAVLWGVAAALFIVLNAGWSLRLAVIVLAVGGTALVAGLLVTVGAARAVADPVNAVRRAMRRVEGGDLEANVTVYDGTELGQLQSGLNTMVAGLQERERIRDLFGRHVGRDVARAAAATGEVRLGGEVRQVAALFVDLVGSTTLAAQRPPGEVVGLLNRLFAVVVEVVEEHGGWVNKFEGDAALAVFGAPVGVPDPAGSALAAGRVLAARLTAELPEVTAGIGISAGDAVAGNVGDVRRYEYTVIGDPVNEAARLTELAKTAPGRVLAAGSAVDLAGASEATRWTVGDAVVLRGRGAATRLASPRDDLGAGKPIVEADGRRGTRQDLDA
jgi:class 3 adenylate cyclase